MMRLPSGDHVGNASQAGSEVNRVVFPLAISSSQMSRFCVAGSVRSKAIRFPSGEIIKVRYIPGSPEVPTTLPCRSNQVRRPWTPPLGAAFPPGVSCPWTTNSPTTAHSTRIVLRSVLRMVILLLRRYSDSTGSDRAWGSNNRGDDAIRQLESHLNNDKVGRQLSIQKRCPEAPLAEHGLHAFVDCRLE